MSTQTIARRYAKALLQIAVEHNDVECFHRELEQFAGALAAGTDAWQVFLDPAVPVATKRAIVKSIADQLALSPIMVNFLLLLIDRQRLVALRAIMECYRQLADEHEGIVRTMVTSARPLAVEQVAALQQALQSRTGRTIHLTVENDPSLIAGIVARIGDTVLDGSIKAQLVKIHDTLQKG